MSKNIPTYHLGPNFPGRLDTFVDRFLADGYRHFEEEFIGLDDFIEKAEEDNKGESLRLTPRPRYLLELVAFRIYDQLNREAFNRAKNTLIVMPDCLSLHNPDCERADTAYGDICRRCVPDCQAYQITELARRYKLKTVFSKRKLGEQLEHYEKNLGDISVIGVACIMMLASGMRTAADVGVPARGVLLSFSGCEHWNDRPCASEFSMTWLESILEEKYGPRDKKA